MSWLFGKKEKQKKEDSMINEDLPELPELPPLPKLEASTLPSPKTAISKKDELPPLPEFRKEKYDLPEITLPKISKKPLTKEISDEIEKPITREDTGNMKTEPVFVRIDKYKQSLEEFQEIKSKILEIETLLNDIKELKSREDTELQDWEQEIQEAKAKLDHIDQTIFEKVK